jgi:hypothetical protein
VADIDPAVILANQVDNLLILAAFPEGRVGCNRDTLNIFDEFTDEIGPVALGVVFNVRYGGRDLLRV